MSQWTPFGRLRNRQRIRPHHPYQPRSHRFVAFFLSASMSFSTYLLNGDRIAAAHPSCSSRQNRHFGQEATCLSTRRISGSESSFKAYRSSSSIDRWATASTIADFGGPRRGGAVILGQCSNRLKTWRRSHGTRLQIGRQRRFGLQGWPATNPITSLTIVNEAVDGGVKVTATGQLKDGTAINYSSTDKYDGKEYPATGAPRDTISMKQINANTFTVEVRKTGGKYHSTGRTVISKDGKSMTTTTKGTDAEGNPTSGTAIYEKQ